MASIIYNNQLSQIKRRRFPFETSGTDSHTHRHDVTVTSFVNTSLNEHIKRNAAFSALESP